MTTHTDRQPGEFGARRHAPQGCAGAPADALLRVIGELDALTPADRRALLDRTTSADDAVRTRVAQVIARVRAGGDGALRALAREFDRVSLDTLEVPRAELDRALDALDPALTAALERAAANIARAHEAFRPHPAEVETESGVVVGRRPDPLARVGIYAPGGRASYPSSVLMGAIPARIAGVGEVIVASPPQPNGLPSPVVLAAARLVDVDRVFAIGGAGAIAAMAYGTASVPGVDRIVGPGNAYVAEAKVQVSAVVGTDAPAGPSELLVLAAGTADPDLVAREMLAQAEHDPLACVVAVAVGNELAGRIAGALARGLALQPRCDIIAEALRSRGAVLRAGSEAEALRYANLYAPEHLLLLTDDPDRTLAGVRNAGTVFLGASSSVAFGDYATGANHVLPTGGLARSWSGLSTSDFVRWTTWQRVSPAAAARLATDVSVLAAAEGLPGHAAAARAWGTR